MPVQLNHTIVQPATGAPPRSWPTCSACPAPTYGPFRVVELDNDVSLDFVDDRRTVAAPALRVPRHRGGVRPDLRPDQGPRLAYWADPFHHRPDVINTNDGGRGLYWSDPDGHNLEIITRPYGG